MLQLGKGKKISLQENSRQHRTCACAQAAASRNQRSVAPMVDVTVHKADAKKVQVACDRLGMRRRGDMLVFGSTFEFCRHRHRPAVYEAKTAAQSYVEYSKFPKELFAARLQCSVRKKASPVQEKSCVPCCCH